MKRIAANLTPLLTCPGFLLWHVLGALVCIPAAVYACGSTDPGDGRYFAIIAVPVWTAYVLTSLQRDLLLKPLVFCMPEYRDVLRRTSFLVGGLVSLAVSLPLLKYPGLGGLDLVWAVWSASCFWMIAYLMVVGSLFVVNHVALSLGPAFSLGAAMLLEFDDARALAQKTAIFTPAGNAVVLAALSWFTWRRVGSVEVARRNCGGRFLSLQMTWRRSASEEFGQRARLEALSRGAWNVRHWLLQRCFARISRRPALSLRRHLAATQYELGGHLVPMTSWALPVTVFLVLFFLASSGYAQVRDDHPDSGTANAAYVVSCVLGYYLFVPVFPPPPPAGRTPREVLERTHHLGVQWVLRARRFIAPLPPRPRHERVGSGVHDPRGNTPLPTRGPGTGLRSPRPAAPEHHP